MRVSPISRRGFIKGAGTMAALALADRAFANQLIKERPLEGRLGQLIGATPESAKNIGGAGTKYGLRNNLFYIYDMDRQIHRELEIPIGLAHDTIVHPTEKNQALVIEREGPYACLVDFASMKVIRRIEASPDHYFTGHATFTPDGEWLWIAEYPRRRLDMGNLLVISTKDYRRVDTIDTGASAPHEMAWFPDKNRVAIGHYGLPQWFEDRNLRSAVVIYDYEKKRVIEEIKAPEQNLYLCHVRVSEDDRLFVLTHHGLEVRGKQADRIREIKLDYDRYVTERPNYFNFSLHDSPILSVKIPKDKPPREFEYKHTSSGYRWGLSLCINPDTSIVGGTHGAGQILTFQDLKTGKLTKEYKFENESPRALVSSLNRRYFIATTDSGSIHYFDAKTLQHLYAENPRKTRYDLVVHAQCVDLQT